MKWPNFTMPDLDWRQPWAWPVSFQPALFVVAGVLGVLMMSPWWLSSGQAWRTADEAAVRLAAQQQDTQVLRGQAAQMLQAQPTIDTFDAATLTTLARQQGLQFSQLGLDKPVQSPAMNALQLQQVTQRLEVQGSWAAWMNWLAQWPVSAPGVTLSSLELKADPRGGISAQLAAVALQPTVLQPLFELAGVDLDGTTSPDPFNAQAWTQTQRHHAQQHPSYAVLVEPELMRSHEPLENFPRERLQYVGQISARSDVEALIKVLPAAGAKKEPSMMTVHRVRVGSHVGQDFGRVLAIATDHVDVRELALEPTGEWRTRDVRLPLHEAAP